MITATETFNNYVETNYKDEIKFITTQMKNLKPGYDKLILELRYSENTDDMINDLKKIYKPSHASNIKHSIDPHFQRYMESKGYSIELINEYEMIDGVTYHMLSIRV